MLWVGKEFFWRIRFDNIAFVKEYNAVGDIIGKRAQKFRVQSPLAPNAEK